MTRVHDTCINDLMNADDRAQGSRSNGRRFLHARDLSARKALFKALMAVHLRLSLLDQWLQFCSTPHRGDPWTPP